MLSGCASINPAAAVCTYQVTRFTDAQIDAMSDEQVRSELAKNEDAAAKGCAVPNT